MMQVYQYYISGQIGARQAFPLGKLTIDYDKVSDDYRHGYKIAIGGRLTFTGDDFTFFYSLERTIYRCDPVQIEIKKLCGGVFIDNWATGQIILNNCSWDLDRGTVEVEIEGVDKYAFFDTNKDTEVNLFDFVQESQREIVDIVPGTLETKSCSNKVSPGCPPDSNQGWVNSKIVFKPDNSILKDYTRYNLGGGNYSKPILYAYSISDISNPTTTYSYKVIGAEISTLDNGMPLKEVLQGLLDHFESGLTLKSDFFQWNPDSVTNINYVTEEVSKVLNLILFQKTDVKTPGKVPSDNAVQAKTTFGDLLNDICILFNLNWEVSGSNFIVEHVSWFIRQQGLDLTAATYARNVAYGRKYSYDTTKLPSQENFTAMESAGQDFVGVPITYTGNCVSHKKDEAEKDYQVEHITTDLFYVISDSAGDGKSISNEGFVLMATDENNKLISGASVLFDHSNWPVDNIDSILYNPIPIPVLQNIGGYLNNSLSWAQLHKDYHKYNRVLKIGTMNNQLTEFKSTVASKKQDKLLIPLCCGDDFDPGDLITSALGIHGEVDSASLDINTNTLELNLIFQQDDSLAGTIGPLANNDNATTDPGTPVTIPVLANDYAPTGTLDSATVSILTQPDHGTTTVNPDGSVIYTPDSAFLGGPDEFSYTVKDNNGEQSNVALVSINVRIAPVAVDDAYIGFKNETLVIAAPGPLANDQGSGLVVDSFGGTSANGGTIILGADGNLRYTPATDFLGADSFPYSIKDAQGLTGTGQITITVQERQEVFVKLGVSNQHDQDILKTCNGNENTVVGTDSLGDISIEFYSDSAGTVPLDIAGYNILLKIKYSSQDLVVGSSGVSHDQIPTTAGTSFVLQAGYIFESVYYDCNSTEVQSHIVSSVQLEPDGAYTIIS